MSDLGNNPFVSTKDDEPLIDIEGSSSTHLVPERPAPRRRRPISFTERSNSYREDDKAEFTTTSLLENAAEKQDFNAIKEGLNFALGTDDKQSHWLPATHNPDTISKHENTSKTDVSRLENSSEVDLAPSINSAISNDPGANLLSPNPFRSYLDPHDIERGPATPTIAVHHELPDSPAKFTDLISRVSERIVGTGGAPIPSGRKSPSINDDNSIKSPMASPLLRPRTPSLHSVANTSNENILTRNSTGVSIHPEVSNKHIPIITQSVEEFTDQVSTSTRVRDDLVFQLPEPHSSKRVGVENIPLANKVKSDSLKNLWLTSTSNMYLFGNSLKIFSPESKFRQLCHHVLSQKITNTVFLVLLALQTCLLAIRQWNPPAHHGYVISGNNWADYILIVINIIYTFEMLAKVVAYGFFDDTIMFEELNLPYPKNEVRAKLLGSQWVQELKSYVDFVFRKTHIKSKSDYYPQYKQPVEDSSDSNDIELDSNIDYLQNKYNTSLHHDTTINDTANLSSRPISASQRLEHKNTLLKPKLLSTIDLLLLRRAYVRNSWHRVDLVSIITFWISMLLSINRYDVNENIMIFRALSCLRILRLCNLTTGTSMILKALKLAVPQLIDVSIFMGCFGIFFAIIGVQSFKSSYRRQCVWYNPDDANDTWVNSEQYCGAYLSSTGTERPYIMANGEHSSSIKGYRCPINSRCESLDNPYDGTVSFDNIFNSLELIFIVLSANTFTDLMYMAVDSEGLVASLFFVFCLFVMTVWLLNVFIAIVVTSFNMTRIGDDDLADEKQNAGVFGPISRPLSMHNEMVEELKKKKIGLTLYYRFQFLFTICIFLDLIAQCFRSYDQTDDLGHSLYRIESGFTLLFFIEIVLRFVLYLPQWRAFFTLKRNCFDLFLAVITGIIIIGPIKEKLGHAYYWLTVFQIMRCYRVVLMLPLTRNLWLLIVSNMKQLLDLTVFFFLITFLTSIIYSRFFEGSISPEEIEDGEVHFNLQTLPNAFVSLYVITSTENWTDILYPMQGAQKTLAAKVFAASLLVGWFFLSNFVILNIFIAVIANTLIVPEAEKKRKQLMQFIENITASIQNADNESGALSRFKNKFFKRKDTKEQFQMAVVSLLLSGTAVHDFLNTDAHDPDEELIDDNMLDLPKNRMKRFFMVNFKRLNSYFNNPFKPQKANINRLDGFDPTNYAKSILKDRNKLIDRQNEFLKENPRYNKVFYVMAPRHKIRRFCQSIVSSSHGERIDGVEPHKRVSEAFTVCMFLVTIALVVTACYFTPLFRVNVFEKYGLFGWTFWLDVGFISIFSIEFIIRVLADGFAFTPNAYTRSPWNLLDFVVLLSLWIEFIAYLKSDGELSRFIRGFKALRALRLLTISETAKTNFHNTMISGITKIISAALVSLCLLFPFAIWGLNIFTGRLGYCVDGVSAMADCKNEYNAEVFNWEIVSPNVFAEPLLNFNDYSKSFSSLFEITSLEGWTDLLYNVMASTGVESPPSSFASPFNGFFVILYNFLGIVFILTLFISVIIHNYSLTTGRAYMTVDQRSWYQVKNFLLQVKPSKNKSNVSLNPIRKFCHSVAVEKEKSWSYLLNFVLILHVIALLIEIYPSNEALDVARFIVYLVASSLFTLNALMIIIAQGVKRFILYRWQIFALIVSLGAMITTIIGTQISNQSAFNNINKLFLVGTLLFVIPRSDRLSQFLRFASASLPNLFSLLFTWLVLFLLFAIALNQVFGTTRIGPNGSDNINVRSVPRALVLLFRCSFGEGWNYIMDDFKIETPFCFAEETSTNTDCGNKQYAYFLFISWNIISMYIFLNMFVSLILDSFSYIMNKGDYAKIIERGEIRKFKKAWYQFDPEGTGFIEPKQLPKLLHSLNGDLSFHFYHGSLEIPVLCHKWIKRNDPKNPYDVTVNYDAIQDSYDSWDIDKIRERRKAYEMFIEEAILNMELNNEPGISFKRILLQLPLYKVFDTGTCLNLIDFLERRLLLQKVQKRLNQNKVYETITAYITRWQYVQNKKLEVKNDSDAMRMNQEIRRRSYLSGDRSPIQQPMLDEQFERDFGKFESLDRDVIDDEVSSSEEERSGVYIPRSPLKSNKSANQSRIKSPPRLVLEVPDLSKVRNHFPKPPTFKLNNSASSSGSLFEEESIGGASDNETPQGLFGVIDVGENLRDSHWKQTLEDLEKSRNKKS